MLVTMKELLVEAKKGGYGVPAPNCFNRESIEACFKAAKKLRSPVILGVSFVHGAEECAEIARYYERKYPEVPFALNQDHGRDFESAVACIRAGFSSIMVDRSLLPYEENVAQVKELVKIAHAVGVTVEAELGHVGMGAEYEQTRDSGLTDPDQAVQFVKDTGIDCLAVAVGTSHGMYKGTPHIDFDLLDTLAERIEIPLVLHGGSGTGDENLSKAIEHGIQKVNLWTDLSMAGMHGTNVAMNGENEGAVTVVTNDEFQCQNWQVAIHKGAETYQAKLEHYMKLFGSANRW